MNMTRPPDVDTPSALCDWVEANALFKGGRVSRTDIEDELVDSEFGGQESADALISSIWNEGQNRHLTCPKNYPINWGTRRVTQDTTWDQAPIYSFMLLLTLSHHYSTLRLEGSKVNKPARLFEYMCENAFGYYLGGETLRFGAPRVSPIPKNFGDAINYLCQKTKEDVGHPRFKTSKLKDDQLDLVSWRNFKDSRSGKIVILGQCAIGHNWKQKLYELPLNIWKGHVRWGIDPIRSFAVPFVHEDGDEWRRNLGIGGLIFDRVRIASLFPNRKGITGQNKNDTIAWCKTQITRFLKIG